VLAAIVSALVALAVARRPAGGARRAASGAEGEPIEHLRARADVVADWSWTTDPDARFSAIEPTRHASLVPFDHSSRGLIWASLLEAGANDEALARIERAMSRREAFRDVLVAHRDGHGAMRFAAVSGAPVIDAHGVFRGYSGGGRDVTPATLRERELIEARSRAEQETAERVAFLANMSHELRSPLNAIIGFSEVMVGGLFGQLGSPRYVGYANDIRSAGLHMLSLVNDVVDFARISGGTPSLEHTTFPLEDAVRESVGLVRADPAGKNRHEIVLKFAARPTVRADRRALRQILANLLANAIRFSREDGRVVVHTAYLPDDRGLVVLVRDFGIGIPDSELPLLGKPFVQLKSGRERGGSGLGLAIARRLVELHGGRLEFMSRTGEGTTAIVLLPFTTVVEREPADAGKILTLE
jgi:signal transduction histidine kinase